MDATGQFWRKHERFEHARIVQYLRQHIEAQSGQYVVRMESQWVPIEIEDLPLRVRSLAGTHPPQHLLVNLDDGRQGVLTSAQTLRCDAQERISCLLPSVSGDSWLTARFSNYALMHLVDLISDLGHKTPQWIGTHGQNTALPEFYGPAQPPA